MMKRSRTDDSKDSSEARPSKAPKAGSSSQVTTHPFFQPKTDSKFNWVSWLGGTCRYGVHLTPKNTSKVAAFDLDGTLIKPKSGARFAKDSDDWKWWLDGDVVPKKLKELHESGYTIVIVTNQAIPGTIKTQSKREARVDKWCKKIPLIAANIPTVPFHIFAATEKDLYRKPMCGTWFELERIFKEDGVEIDLATSFYAGDAGGRTGDHNVSDRLYAMNVGIPFITPEELFLNKPPKAFTLRGFHPSSIPHDPETPLYTPTSTPLIPPNPVKPEIVLFVGYPATGKSTFYKKHFSPAGYVHVNQDTLKSKANCLKAVRGAITSGKSCVVDNTNRDLATRADYHEIAKDMNVSIRALHFNLTLDLAWHINIYRSFCLTEAARADEAARELVPHNAFSSFQNAFQKPTVEEGFAEVKTINWIFDGTDEEKRRFNMYLNVFF